MAYTRGDSKQIIVGAAALFVFEDGEMAAADLPTWVPATKAITTIAADADFRNVGYTTNGLELQYQPDFGEVKVDQQLDVAKLFKQGMQVTMKTTLAEATLENLVLAIAAKDTDLAGGELTLKSGELGDAPIERGLVAIGPGPQTVPTERIYAAYRALSMDSVTISAKRDEASQFEISFRMLPDNSGTYGKIIDRAVGV
jgi:hypothetical protein